MSNKNTRQILIERINEVLNTPNDDLIKNSKANQTSGVLIFNEITPKIVELKGYIIHLNIDNISELPESRFAVLNSKLKPIFDELDKIQTTEKNPNQADHQQKTSTVQFFNFTPNQGGNNYFEKEKEMIWNIVLEAITLENRKFRDNSDPLKKTKELELVLNNAKESQEKINEVLNSARIELSKGGVNKHAGIFEEQAIIHQNDSKSWKNNTVGLLMLNVVLVILILISVIWVIDDRSIRIEVGIFGAILVSLISYAIVLCTKNYFAEKHNQNVNQHRANCLGTYNTFVDSADDERKASILSHATNTIFSHQNSGYLSKNGDSKNPNPMIEIIRNITKNSTE